ncbi:MAG: GNAT family N-acetyltransferase [Oscillospiraceae bacterium]|nr:GNAT family N-acetyltransferase [Oscillospiraceae bacterium]
MNEVLCRQLAADYCCGAEEVRAGGNVFTTYRPLEGRRRFQERKDCFLKIAAVGGKLLFTGRSDVVARCRERYADCGSEWFFEPDSLRELDGMLRADGRQIASAHPFFIAERPTEPRAADCELRWYEREEIERFRGDERFGEAFCFCPEAPDMLGVAALREGRIIGMAGASADSPTMWQIGVNVDPASRGEGVATLLVTLLKNEILKKGILPFYGTSPSHLASQRVALGAGFLPAWAELVTEEIPRRGGKDAGGIDGETAERLTEKL